MSTKDILLAGINEAVAKRNNMKFEDYQKAANESFATDRDAEKGVINSAHDASKANVQAQYDNAVTDTKVGYESEYQKNAVQKLINEKKVAETNANLGLTDSGLNRTQQTAVQLSYANQKGKIDLARQGALDDLALNLTSALTEIETNRSVDLLTADQKYNDKAYLAAQTNYNNDLTAFNDQIASGYEQYSAIAQAEIDAAADVQKAQISAKQLSEKINVLNSKNSTLGNLQGSFASNGITSIHNANGSTTYTDTVTGVSVTMDAGINPFTGQNNLTENTETAKSAQKYGTFSNGYQPKGIIGYGELSGALKNSDGTYLSYEINGRNNTIWKAKDKKDKVHYFIWDGNHNEYIEMKEYQFEEAKAEANK